ncbi:hypothetical protein [Candidatus Pelagibacter sp.]|uniref:hypothetical protein n=1 Tax=Candidatus Pelagibacter sp. TaxID=2024849 RepID=UPI003F864988
MSKEIVFIGSSAIGLEKLSQSKRFKIIDVLCLKKKVNPELEIVTNKLGLKIKSFNWINDFEKLINLYENSIPFFIYQLDMLVPAILTEKYNFFNLHRGNLKTNRGPNPDIWPILLGHKSTSITLHKINSRIDLGIAIDWYDVEISNNDSVNDVIKKLEKGLPKLIESTYLFILGKLKGENIEDGIYRPWVTEQDFTIDLTTDSMDTIDQKIRSQKNYNGAIFFHNGKKKYVINVFSSIPSNLSKIISTKKDNKNIYFLENTKPKYQLPKFPPSKRI